MNINADKPLNIKYSKQSSPLDLADPSKKDDLEINNLLSAEDSELVGIIEEGTQETGDFGQLLNNLSKQDIEEKANPSGVDVSSKERKSIFSLFSKPVNKTEKVSSMEEQALATGENLATGNEVKNERVPFFLNLKADTNKKNNLSELKLSGMGAELGAKMGTKEQLSMNNILSKNGQTKNGLKSYENELKSLDVSLIGTKSLDKNDMGVSLLLNQGNQGSQDEMSGQMGSEQKLENFIFSGPSASGEMNAAKNIDATNLSKPDVKNLDLSNINIQNTNEVISKISDYIQQERVGNATELDVNVTHSELGQFKIHVTKQPGNEQVNMRIETVSDAGQKFFQEHEVELVKTLDRSGVKLSEFKITQSQSPSGQNLNSDLSQQQDQGLSHRKGDSKQQFGSNAQSNDEGKERRRELWDFYQNKFNAA